ncbi:MAG: adenosylcobinamide-phosphate synthase CbiB [Dehalococcoidia bacterium]
MLGIPTDILVLAVAVLLDLVVGEFPNRLHPTVWMGKTVSWAEKLAPQGLGGALLAGALLALLIPGGWAAAAYFVGEGLQSLHDLAYILVGGVLLKSTFSLRMLHRVAAQVRSLLLAGDLQRVRAEMRSLVSRDASSLSPEQATAATVESVSENITDSFVGPWLAFALFGLPGAFAYRAINTLDSMIGYHGKYEYLGKASAKLDDLTNLVPARLTALLLVLGSGVLPGQRAASAWRIMWRDHGRTESPNAGWTMSGMAGALGVALEKEGHYRLGEETRPLEPQDISRAIQTMYLVAALGAAIALGLIVLRHEFF